MSVPEILQMRMAALAWNDSTTYGPFCELFFVLMQSEPAEGEAFVGTSLVFWDYIRIVETRCTERKGVHAILFSSGTKPQAGMEGCRCAQRGRSSMIHLIRLSHLPLLLLSFTVRNFCIRHHPSGGSADIPVPFFIIFQMRLSLFSLLRMIRHSQIRDHAQAISSIDLPDQVKKNDPFQKIPIVSIHSVRVPSLILGHCNLFHQSSSMKAPQFNPVMERSHPMQSGTSMPPFTDLLLVGLPARTDGGHDVQRNREQSSPHCGHLHLHTHHIRSRFIT